MDSMRSLNRSLPSAQSKQPAPPEQLLQAFRQAALSVTNLYKSAASDHESIRQAGYQDALDDLLKFLDKENLGLQDGEGWRVRQWATARYDGTANTQHSDEEEETADPEQEQRSSSPEKNVEEGDNTQHQPEQSTSSTESQQHQPPSHTVFHFSAGTDHAMQTEEPQPQPQPSQSSSLESRTAPVRLEVVNRTNRNAHKQNTRHGSRSITRTPSATTGSKRKMPFPDISEIFSVGFDKKDAFDGGNGGGGSGGSKRSRLV